MNREIVANQYVNSFFRIEVEFLSIPEHFILHNAHYVTNNDNLISLIEAGRAEVLCVVESSTTVFRKTYPITQTPQDISIPLYDLRDNVVISAYAYAKETITGFTDSDFLEDYQGVSFNIEKYDIIACDDGFTQKVKYDESEDTKVSSIFLVVKDIETRSDVVRVNERQRNIVLNVPGNYFNMYDKMKMITYLQNVFFAAMLIPALSAILERYKNDDLDDLRYRFDWFSSIEKAYEKNYGSKLTNESLQKTDSIELAQNLLGFSMVKSIETVYTMMQNKKGRADDDE